MAAEEKRSLATTTVVVADPRQVSVEMGEETLILHLETGGYYSLRNVAARIWELLKAPSSVSEISVTLARQYGIPRERCETDLLELLSDLVERGLVRVVHDGRDVDP
ncbi:MAG: PqqD family protein [Gemmatimonadales bacterium]